MSDNKNKYFAQRESKEKAQVLTGKAQSWFTTMESNGYLEKIRQTWSAYYGIYYSGFSDSHKLTFSGEQAELVNLSVNHLRNIGDHMINMITSVRPSMEARSVNTDSKSVIQTKLANGILDYYTRDKRLEKYLERAVESAVTLAGGYIKLEWNATSGEVYDFSEELNTPIYEGDIQFTNLSPFDVYYDGNKEDDDCDWLVCRSFKNRYDLVAKYPELEDAILRLPSKNEYEYFDTSSLVMEDTDLVAVYEFYHKRTEAMPDGNYMLYLSEDAVLVDTNLPYRKIPVYRIAPSYILGTPYGYTPLFDLLPLQDAINSLYSTILSNQNALGLANILSPRNSDIDFSELGSGLNVIEYNAQAGKPEALQLLQTPKELFDFLRMLEQAMETISGINSVTRGNPDKQLTSGNALALVQSMAIQFISRLQRSYVQLVEDVGSGIIDILKDYAQTPRIVNIVGKANKTYAQEFTGSDLNDISRVIVDVSNPLARTTAGRVQMAEQMLQMGIISNPKDYMSVINTGEIESLTDDEQRQIFLARMENEKMMQMQEVLAVFTDDHAYHIKEHSNLMADPDLRFNQEMMLLVYEHIQEHVNLLRTTDPDILKILNQQPLGPLGGSPANQPPQDINQGSPQLPPAQIPGQEMMPQEMGAIPANQPNLPKPAGEFSNLPTDPAMNIPQ
jgi:hypothetical protein